MGYTLPTKKEEARQRQEVLVAMRYNYKAAEVAWVGVPLLNGFVGVWLYRATQPFRRRNGGLHSPE